MNAAISIEEFSHSKKELYMQLSAAESSLVTITDTWMQRRYSAICKPILRASLTLLRSSEKSTDEKNAAAKELIKACKFDKTAESLEIIYHAVV